MKKPLFAIVVILAIGCATYTSRMELSRELYYDGRYGRALKELDRLAEDARGADRFLLLLERGKTNLALGEYAGAIGDLRAADDRFGEIEGTISASDFIRNTMVNPARGEFQPDSHEKILLSSYLLLAYWLNGDREGAFVERNRIMGKLKQFAGNPSEGDQVELDAPFARYLAALLYEVEGSEDDARIEYEELERLRPGTAPGSVDTRLTELALFAEIGRAPLKVSTEIRGYLRKEGGDLVGFFNLPDFDVPLIFRAPVSKALTLGREGVLFTFAFPRYVRQEREVHRVMAVIDGMEAGEAVPLDLVEDTAIASFERKLGMILLKAAFRTYIKTAAQTKLSGKKGGTAGDILGKVLSAVDRADTRSWQTLPAEVHVFRLECEPGSHEVYARYLSESGEQLGRSGAVTVSIEKGSKQIVYLPGPA